MAALDLVTLVVDAYDPAIEFFVERLGFTLLEDSPSVTDDGRPKRWVVVRPPGGRTGILLAQADGDDQTAIVGAQVAGRVGFFLRVDDFDEAYDRLVSRGVEFVRPPRAEAYGTVAVFLDIAGNRWDLLGPGGRPAAPVAGPRPRLVLICGLPASGKSTLAGRLAPEIPAVRLDKDSWTTQLGADVWDEEFRVRLERQLWLLTQDLLVRGQSVILEWGHWARVERDEKRLAARALGVGVELHYLDVPLDELIGRAARRTASGEWTASPITRAHFETWATTFEPPDDEELLLFDEPRAAE